MRKGKLLIWGKIKISFRRVLGFECPARLTLKLLAIVRKCLPELIWKIHGSHIEEEECGGSGVAAMQGSGGETL